MQKQPRRPRPARRRLLFGVLTSVISIVVVVVLAELALRWFYPQDRFLSLVELGNHVRNARGADLVVDTEFGCAPRTSSRTRDAQGILIDPGDKAAKATNVLFLGDSVTRRGTILRGLQAIDTDPQRGFLNAGVDSWNPIQEIGFCFRHGQHERAGHVVLMFHNNDFMLTPVGLFVDGQFMLCMPGSQTHLDPSLYEWSMLYRLYVNARNRDLGTRPTYEQMRPKIGLSLRRLRDELRARGSRLTVLLLPIFDVQEKWSPLERQSRTLALELLQELELETIDLLEPVQQLLALGFEIQEKPGDRWHPNDPTGTAMAWCALERGLFGPWSPTARCEPAFVGARDAARPGDGDGGAPVLRVRAGKEHAGKQVAVIGCTKAPRAGWWKPGMDLEVAIAGFQARGGVLLPGQPILGLLDPSGEVAVALPPVPGGPVLSLYLAVAWKPERERIDWVSNCAPLLVAR